MPLLISIVLVYDDLIYYYLSDFRVFIIVIILMCYIKKNHKVGDLSFDIQSGLQCLANFFLVTQFSDPVGLGTLANN